MKTLNYIAFQKNTATFIQKTNSNRDFHKKKMTLESINVGKITCVRSSICVLYLYKITFELSLN